MLEVKGNLWTYPADVVVITTNGTIKANGECVMGRGCAAEAKRMYPAVPKQLGTSIKAYGNIVSPLLDRPIHLVSFPVKHRWHEKADVQLIERSAHALVHAANTIYDGLTFVMPRPGCGNGGLKWDDVKPVIEPILDDRFHVITW